MAHQFNCAVLFEGDVSYEGGDDVLDYEEFRGLGDPVMQDHHQHSGRGRCKPTVHTEHRSKLISSLHLLYSFK